MKTWIAGLAVLFTAASAQAHVMVSPPQSKAGVDQKYEVRVHNETKVATTQIDLEIPAGITVVTVATPASGTYETAKTGARITSITWHVDVPAGKYLALPFTAHNPDGATEVRWNVRQHLADGSVVEWSDKPGAKEKAPATAIAPRAGTDAGSQRR